MNDQMGSDTSKRGRWQPTPYLGAPELAIPMATLQLSR
jgi:hypothetical protein